MDLNDYVAEALDLVLAQELPDEVCPQAVLAEAALRAHIDPDQLTAPVER